MRLAELLQSERERWVLWLPVAMGTGISAYFALPAEPPLWPAPLATALVVAALPWCRRSQLAWVIAVAVAVMLLGFSAASIRARLVAAPVITAPTGMIAVEGRIRDVQPLDDGTRLLLDHLWLGRAGRENGGLAVPERLRITFKGDLAQGFAPGDWVRVRALAFPPPPPVAPGAYDFARQAWFQRLGGVGIAFAAPERLEPPSGLSWSDRLALVVARMRRSLAARIEAAIDGGGLSPGIGAVAAALVTGERGPVPPKLLQDYRDAGLAHVLVIAGLHMSMVAGLVFFALRGLLASIPPLALHYPIKKWTAAAALLITAGYLIIAGAPVPTQRAFLMSTTVLLAIFLDRQAISLRTLAWTATAILLIQPEALLGPSFQMSFAAVVGLVSAYEALGPFLARLRREHRAWWERPLLYVGGILLTTLVASLATAFLTVYHFDRYASYSLVGNLLAVPVVGFWVMPSALLAMLLLPFGLDRFGWLLMGRGIEVVDHVATFTSNLPKAAIDLPSMPVPALVLFSLGGLWLCLWRRNWRLIGLVGMTGGLLIAVLHRPPDLLVSADGRNVAARTTEGALAFAGPESRGGASLRASWAKLAGEGDSLPAWPAADACDDFACRWRVSGRMVVLARRRGAGCAEAALVLAAAPGVPCPGLVVDYAQLRQGGNLAVWLASDAIRMESVTAWQGDRPWRRLEAATGSTKRLADATR